MERTKIFARHIQHLTDARYFAAMGADWMSFDLRINSPHHIPRINFDAIKEWVEGPMVCVESNEDEQVTKLVSLTQFDQGLQDIIIETSLDALKQLDVIPSVSAIIIKEDKLAVLLDEIDFLHHLEVPYYIDGMITVDKAVKIAQNIGNAGITLYGAAEEKIGFKDYNEIDDIIEAFID